MEGISGRVAQIRIFQEEGGRDWALALSKLLWCGIWVALPISLFRLLNDLLGLPEAVLGVVALAGAVKLLGPFNLVMLDELISRIFPSMRSAIRMGMVRVYDFRVVTDEGREVACVLRGNLVGSGPAVGDRLALEGRRRWGTLWVRRGLNEGTGSLFAPRPIRSGWILLATALVMGLLIAYLAGALDGIVNGSLEWILSD